MTKGGNFNPMSFCKVKDGFTLETFNNISVENYIQRVFGHVIKVGKLVS